MIAELEFDVDLEFVLEFQVNDLVIVWAYFYKGLYINILMKVCFRVHNQCVYSIYHTGFKDMGQIKCFQLQFNSL